MGRPESFTLDRRAGAKAHAVPGFAEAPVSFAHGPSGGTGAIPHGPAEPSFADGLSARQVAWARVAACGLALLVMADPVAAGLVLLAVLSVFFLALVLLRLVLMSLPGLMREGLVLAPEVWRARVRDWPVYTVMVALHREAEVLPILVDALARLDYPADRLDVKLILEETDPETLGTALALPLPRHFEIVVVPDGAPRTKPRALNHALPRARGDYVVIYDAEDRPDPDQLKKAVLGFEAAPADTACLQARLAYFNAGENWLTRMFAIEYAVWFEILLPGLAALRLPVPLGGTSIHFRTDVLRGLGAWDAWNVTEDADLGLRLARRGWRCRMLESTTLEEANCRAGNWIRQRSRWLKGYAQTWFAHMRAPGDLRRDLGWRGLLGVQVIFAGAVIGALAHPVLWALYLVWAATGTGRFDPLFPAELAAINTGLLILGSGVVIVSGMVAVARREVGWLVPWCPLLLFYWPLASLAAWRAVWQLVHRPSYWEKTAHGLSRETEAARDGALARLGPARQAAGME